MSGKGDNPRPFSVTPEEFGQKFDAIDWGAREREANQAQPFDHAKPPPGVKPDSFGKAEKP